MPTKNQIMSVRWMVSFILILMLVLAAVLGTAIDDTKKEAAACRAAVDTLRTTAAEMGCLESVPKESLVSRSIQAMVSSAELRERIARKLPLSGVFLDGPALHVTQENAAEVHRLRPIVRGLRGYLVEEKLTPDVWCDVYVASKDAKDPGRAHCVTALGRP